MKKYLIILPLLLIFLIPSNVFADSYTIWKVPYKNSSYSSYDTFYGYYGTSTSNLHGATEYTSSFYYQSTTFEKSKFDYVEIPITIYIDATGTGANMGDSSFYTIPNADTMYYVVNNLMLNVSITYSNSQYDAHSDCEVVPNNYNGNNITGIAKCPVNRVADGIRYVSLKHTYQGISASSNYTIFFGSTGWLNFLYKDDNSGSIASAITSQTSSITNAQNNTTSAVNDNTTAINNLNSNITSTSTNGNGIDSATSTIQNLIPTDSKTEGYYNNVFSFFNRVKDSVNTSCSAYSMQLMEQTITFPCVDMASIFGDWWGVIDMLCCIWPIINIFNLFIGWVDAITDLEDMSYFSQAKHVHWSREDYRKGMYY